MKLRPRAVQGKSDADCTAFRLQCDAGQRSDLSQWAKQPRLQQRNEPAPNRAAAHGLELNVR
ncbi:hypothetical protein XFF6166_210025 [Xanthomonas citri pv. fuscans]|nr:hypothetical protein XFF6166_210025 [Xanthomonas citri pv. fuscans]SOO00109.1 hypothetical protein XFF6960_240024 [Xanthomonas citri pv. fuscans]SOO06309.1 hypothetical protein XFF7767_70041 [Xanthomonas citri pv. fuscans]SOO10345.1 hypothetical protein XFF6970_540025 [Xanthomonas citri pv. fuscans]SOO14999.1 hypothetical protein XFF7766_460052 [Xanthomonas citri pv. fuscans]